MARIRTIKPSFFRDHGIADLPLTARLTFIGLWTYVDDAGRGVDDARLVKGDLWQLDEKHTVKKVEADLVLLAASGFIERYSVDNRSYLRVVHWDHQKINRPTQSPIPEPLSERAVSPHGAIPADSPWEGKGREGNKEGKGGDSAPSERGVAPVVCEHVAREAEPSPRPSDGAGSPDTTIDEETRVRNVERIRSARLAIKSA